VLQEDSNQKMPLATAEIFAWLSQGKFISVDSPDPVQRHWFYLLAQSRERFFDYFFPIGFQLEQGEGYFFFSREEKKAVLEERIDKFLKWLDWLHLCLEIEPAFGPGFRFSVADLGAEIDERPRVLKQLRKLGLRGNPQKGEEALRLFTRELERAGFCAQESEDQCRVLAAFAYLPRLIQRIQLNSQKA
jgi:hypothetical protein